MLHTKTFIWTLIFFGAAASLEVKVTPSYSEISVGQSKFFLCEVDTDTQEIDWYLPSGEKISPNRPDISITLSDRISTLIIYNADLDKAGVYRCVARSGDSEAQGTINVTIFQQLEIKNAPSPQEFTEGDTASIVCDVVASPPPVVTWRHKGIRVRAENDVRYKILNNNHLQIRGIRKSDEGTYVCEGRVMVRGEISLMPVDVIVNVFPTIRIRQAEVNATADMSQPVILACDADGSPEPTVTWTRNKIVLENGNKYSFNEDGSEMTIKGIIKLDESEYVCTARNKAGQQEKEISLKVFVKPKITYLENLTTSELEEQVMLTCEALGDPTPTITWSFGSHVFTEGESDLHNRIYQASWTRPEQHKSADGHVVVRSDARVSSLTLKTVQYSDAGEYLCTARNAVGQEADVAHLEVRYAPKIQGAVTVYTWEGNSANISCEVLAHPAASVAWFRDGLPLPSSNGTSVRLFSTATASYLEVTPESQSDFGSYNCTATNAIGTESKEFLLIQAEVPSSPSLTKVEAFSGSARLEFQEPEAGGGVPVLRYRLEWRQAGRGRWDSKLYEVLEGGPSALTIGGLKPDTHYEVKMYAINGKGEGDSSQLLAFVTEPVREPSAPRLEAQLQPAGNALRVSWTKQDDGGSPITHYIVSYKAKLASNWRPEIRLPSGSEFVVLHGLDWNTEYNVYVVAENRRGQSQPATLALRTAPAPTAAPDPLDSGRLGTGAVAGILVVAFVVLLVIVDVACFFINKCGLLMCLAANVCGKQGAGAKGKDFEGGMAAFSKDESREPIVEVRTEEETQNHDGGVLTEPSETTPLTDSERAVDITPTVTNLLPSPVINCDTPDSLPTSDSMTPLVPQSSTPKATGCPRTAPRYVTLVDLSDAPTVTAPPTGRPAAAQPPQNETSQNPPEPSRAQSSLTSSPKQNSIPESSPVAKSQ
ncbi:neural cell adhesion molecule 1-like isoform X2 [Paramormyrops kingsleyae]|uniref:neural cell adhesion molecule 1-like isoform X2 n=1 Tax=Paramormyrops kingsleyae TaxID=1676925 RepID=UPI000CD65683|nr:neural cell adhesion molecule 1-like isoform X2 [Paramormyrops kingsleyae]